MKGREYRADRAKLVVDMRRLARGERAALDGVYRATSAKLFGICLRIIQDRGEAEEALQEVYINLWQRADRFDPDRGSPIAWLATLARNCAIDRLRRKPRAGRSEPLEAAATVEDPTALPDEVLERREGTSQIQRCLDGLEDRQRSAIRTAFYDGLTYAELAGRNGVPLGTMKSWVRRGLARLKQCLEA